MLCGNVRESTLRRRGKLHAIEDLQNKIAQRNIIRTFLNKKTNSGINGLLNKDNYNCNYSLLLRKATFNCHVAEMC